MFITFDSPQNAVKMPVQIARSLDEMNYGQERGEIAPPALVEFINSMADACDNVHQLVAKRMKRTQAINVCRKIKPLIPALLEAERVFLHKYQETYSPSIIAMTRLFESARVLVGEALFIANGSKIEEKELDAFLLEHASRRTSSPEARITGRSAVLALVD